VAYKTLDFARLTRVDPSASDGVLVVNLNSGANVRHAWPAVDRCCNPPPPDFDVNAFDDIEKIGCDIRYVHMWSRSREGCFLNEFFAPMYVHMYRKIGAYRKSWRLATIDA
jgi:hypothetical protein